MKPQVLMASLLSRGMGLGLTGCGGVSALHIAASSSGVHQPALSHANAHHVVYLPNRELPNPGFQAGHAMETFLTPEIGWQLTFGGASTGSQAATLFVTTDGGHAWRRIRKISAAFPGMKDGLSFLTQDRGWLAGAFSPGAWRVEPLLYQTANGGRTWFRVALPWPIEQTNAELNLAPPAFFSATQGILVGYYSSVPKTGPVGALWVTTNSGRTWHWEPVRQGHIGRFAWNLPHRTTLSVTCQGRTWVSQDDGYVWHAQS
ncbi:MAG: hypothetical protein OWU33_12375 [Firmicutes bacterium]|nr:hypothetical protein [Bacillota bacterium]